MFFSFPVKLKFCGLCPSYKIETIFPLPYFVAGNMEDQNTNSQNNRHWRPHQKVIQNLHQFFSNYRDNTVQVYCT